MNAALKERLKARLTKLLRTTLLLQIAGALTLVGLALMVWSMLQPTPLPVMLAMSVGQAIGTTAFALYLFVVIREIRREWRGKPKKDPGA